MKHSVSVELKELEQPTEKVGDPYGLLLHQSLWQSKVMWMDYGSDATVVQKSEAYFRKDEEPVWVFPQVSVNCVEDINSAKQSFVARYTFFLNITLTEREFDEYHKDPRKWVPSNLPTFMPYNASRVDRIEPIVNPDGTVFSITIHRGYWCFGSFFEHSAVFSSPFDLHNFPFDIQTLEIKFEIRDNHRSWTRPRTKFMIKSEPYWKLNANSACFQNVWVPPQGEWRIQPNWIMGETFIPNSDSWGPIYQVVIKIERQWKFYAWHVVFLLVLIGISSTFMFILDNIGDILQYMAGLLVAAVAFLFTISSNLPAVEYLTLLDKYLMSIILFVLLTGALNIIIEVIDGYDFGFARNSLKLWFFFGDASLLFLAHAYFFFRGLTMYYKEKKKLELQPRFYTKELPNVYGKME